MAISTIPGAGITSSSTITSPNLTNPTVTSGTLTLTSSGLTFSDASTQTSTSLGYSQTWQSVTRSTGVVYTNSTGRPIQVIIAMGSGSGTGFAILINNVVSYNGGQTNSSTLNSACYFVVPNNNTYYVTTQSGQSTAWFELR